MRPVAAAVAGTLLCISTFGVFATAIILANNDRRAEARAERRESSAVELHETFTDSSALADAATAQADEHEGGGQKQYLEAKALQSVVQSSSPHDERCSQLEEKSKYSMPEPSKEEQGTSAWLALVVGGNLCSEVLQYEDAQHEEAL